jgi:hypothetical protein
MKVFLSYAVGQMDAPIAARLRAVAAAYDISIILPDRTRIAHGLPVDTQKKIKQSDAIIALVTKAAPPLLKQLVNLELQAATQIGKPIIPLIEEGVPIQFASGNQIVYFNRFMPTSYESSLRNILEQLYKHQQKKNDLTALGWIAGIALGMVALGKLVGDEK